MRDRKTYHSFLLYTENGEAVQELSDADAGKLLKDLFRFVQGGCAGADSALLPDAARPIAALMRSQISRAKAKYEGECDKRQEAINKRWEAERKRREAEKETSSDDSQKKSVDKNTSVYKSIHVNSEDDVEVEVEDEVEDVVEDESNNTPKGVSDRHEKKIPKKSAAEPLREGVFLADYVLSAWQEFVSMRKRIRKPLTGNAESRIRKKLEKLSGGDTVKAEAILLQSVDNCWQDIFDVREDHQRGTKGNGHKPIDWENV